MISAQADVAWLLAVDNDNNRRRQTKLATTNERRFVDRLQLLLRLAERSAILFLMCDVQ